MRLVRESPALPRGVTVIGELAAAASVKERLLELGRDLGLIEADADSFDVLRIEAGTPVFGKEVTDKNLPQEFGRDDRAISFVKGCYLGQETVARIDALGHVNQMLEGTLLRAGFTSLSRAWFGLGARGQTRRCHYFGRLFAGQRCFRGPGNDPHNAFSGGRPFKCSVCAGRGVGRGDRAGFAVRGPSVNTQLGFLCDQRA